jgi:hypothetical protein
MPGDYRDATRGGDPRQQQPRAPPQHDDAPPTHTQAGAAAPGYDRSAARVFMSFTSDATRFGAAVYDRDVHTIEAVEVRTAVSAPPSAPLSTRAPFAFRHLSSPLTALDPTARRAIWTTSWSS